MCGWYQRQGRYGRENAGVWMLNSAHPQWIICGWYRIALYSTTPTTITKGGQMSTSPTHGHSCPYLQKGPVRESQRGDGNSVVAEAVDLDVV